MEPNTSEASIMSPKMVNLLNNNHEIIESILKNLYLKDLSSAALVCKLWNTIAKKFKKNTTVQISVNNYEEVKSENYFKNAIVIPKDITPKFCVTLIDYGVYDRHWYYLEAISGGSRKELNKLEKYKMSHVHKKLKDSLPTDCTSMLLTRPSAAIKYYDCTERPEESLIGYVTLGFPEIPGVTIQPFEMDSGERKADIISVADIDHSKKLKFLILFAKSDQCESRLKTLVTDINSKQKESYVHGIIMMHPLYKLNDRKHELDYIKGIAFSGENIHVLTTIIYENEPANSIETHILNLKSSEFPCFRHNSVAFMFYRRRKDIQLVFDAFKRHFPNTVLAAMLCDGVCKMEEGGDKPLGLVSVSSLLEGDTVGENPAQIIVLSWC